MLSHFWILPLGKPYLTPGAASVSKGHWRTALPKGPPTRVWQQPKLPQLHSTILETGLFFVSQRFKSITCLENILQHSGSTAEGVHWFDRFTQLPDVSGCNLRGDVSVFLLISLVIFMSWNINCIASIRSHSCLWSFLMLWNFYKLHEIEIE